MGALWTPPGSAPARIAGLPAPEDLRLGDGRWLRLAETFAIAGPTADAPALAWRTADDLRVIASMDPTPLGRLLHVSLSYGDHLPPWSDVALVKARFFGQDIDAMMVLPRELDYVHGVPGWPDSTVLHITQTPQVWGMS